MDPKLPSVEAPEESRWAPPKLPFGELLCVQTNARKNGQLFRNMFHLKQVELDDHPYIWGLQAELPEELEPSCSSSEEGGQRAFEQCRAAFAKLEGNIQAIGQRAFEQC